MRLDGRPALGVKGHGDGFGNPDGEELPVLRHGVAVQCPLVSIARVPVRKVAAVLGEVLWPLGGFAMLHSLYEVGLAVVEVEGYGVNSNPLGVEGDALGNGAVVKIPLLGWGIGLVGIPPL